MLELQVKVKGVAESDAYEGGGVWSIVDFARYGVRYMGFSVPNLAGFGKGYGWMWFCE